MKALSFIKKYNQGITSEKTPLVFLHGFSGNANEWKDIFPSLPNKFFPIAIDLPGHGNNGSPTEVEAYTAKSTVTMMNNLFDDLNFDKVIIIGYSMGGRAALSYAKSYPDKMKGLFLESSTAGIDDAREREIRIEKDTELALFIENNSIEKFVYYWMDLPLFNSQKKLSWKKLDELTDIKRKNNKTGLANSLRGFGTGVMPSLWSDIKDFNLPVQLITGELDLKFTSINKKMNLIFPHCNHVIIENSGHNIHLENPDEFLSVLLFYLNQF